jgi:hypothetical protein
VCCIEQCDKSLALRTLRELVALLSPFNAHWLQHYYCVTVHYDLCRCVAIAAYCICSTLHASHTAMKAMKATVKQFPLTQARSLAGQQFDTANVQILCNACIHSFHIQEFQNCSHTLPKRCCVTVSMHTTLLALLLLLLLLLLVATTTAATTIDSLYSSVCIVYSSSAAGSTFLLLFFALFFAAFCCSSAAVINSHVADCSYNSIVCCCLCCFRCYCCCFGITVTVARQTSAMWAKP